MLTELEVNLVNESYNTLRKKISQDIKQIMKENKIPMSLLAEKLGLLPEDCKRIIEKTDLTLSLLSAILSLIGSEPYFLITPQCSNYLD